MKRILLTLAAALLLCAAAQAATISTTLTVNATLTIGTSVSAAGTASLTNGVGNGTFSATLALGASGYSGPYTITLAGGGGTITGVLTMPATMLAGSGTASATVTGGTGTYSGANGSFPSLPGSTTFAGTGFSLTFSGAGTFGTGGTNVPPPPTITAVLDAASNTPNVAQGSIFIVKGANLCATQQTFYSVPRPSVGSDGLKITFTPAAGGNGTNALLWYEYNPSGTCQLAGILPSTVTAGSYNVTVTNGTVSAPFASQVVASKLELFTQDSSGGGQASIQNYVSATQYDLNRLTTGTISGITYSPATPGQSMIAYGTGLGAYATGDNSASPVFDFSKTLNIQAIVGGISVPVAFAGRAGYAGEDQLNFTLPSNVQTGCAVTLQISVNGVLSAPTTISVAPSAGSSTCVLPGYTTAQLQKLDQGGTITGGAFSITQYTITAPSLGTYKSDTISGGFTQLTAFQMAAAAQSNVSVIQQGSCQVVTVTSGGSSSASGSLKSLDAGTVTVNGPAGSSLANQPLTELYNSYSIANYEGFSIPGQVNFSLPAGVYSLSGNGGTDVGSFSTSLTLPSPLTLSAPLPTNVVRSSPLTLNWTGGNSTDLVEILGGSSITSGTGSNQVTSTTSFICLTTAGQKTFTVPASVLSQLPATPAGGNPGLLEVASGNQNATFAATLKADGSTIPGTFGSFIGIGDTPTYQ